ncbi:hypothetical protein C9374_014087 [Naegleria lovaniensis]|uniref:ENTH domain-containing protein n=1 Tax=Naegleria lovaniensis TaxID=51637 RepID=A0AA88GV78_NAELO|nr:uncharacterized protein C9374_014087 [Naegleria lovaniensis]KAG2389527.1 hypothetical protein C9374_014087 [Naegleria lovaniensis]
MKPIGNGVYGGGIGSTDNDYTTASDTENKPAYGGGFGSNSMTGFGPTGIGSRTDTQNRIGTYAGGGIASPYAQQKQAQSQQGGGFLANLSNLTTYIPTFGKGTTKETHGLNGSDFPGLISSSEYDRDGGQGTYVGVVLPPGGSAGLGSGTSSSGRGKWLNESQSTSSTQKADTSGEYESKIVNEFTSHGGVKRAAPSRKESSDFAQKCSTLDILQVVKLLDVKLDDHEWVTRLKALHGIEALLKTGNKTVMDYFSENCENILKQSEAVQETIRQQAEKVAKLLNFNDNDDDDESNYGPTLIEGFQEMSVSSGSKSQQRKPVSFVSDPSTSDADSLLGIATTTADNSDDIFGGFDISSGKSSESTKPTSTSTNRQPLKKSVSPSVSNNNSNNKSTSTATPSSPLDLDFLLSSAPPATPNQTNKTPTQQQQPTVSPPFFATTYPYPQTVVPPTAYPYGVPYQVVYATGPVVQQPIVQPIIATKPPFGHTSPLTKTMPPPILPQSSPQHMSPSSFGFISEPASTNKQEHDSFDFVKEAYLK